jgi:hypothetical protein
VPKEMIWKGRKTRVENTEVKPECRNRNARRTLARRAASAVGNSQVIRTNGPSNERIRYVPESLKKSKGMELSAGMCAASQVPSAAPSKLRTRLTWCGLKSLDC